MHIYRVLFSQRHNHQWGYVGFRAGRLAFTHDLNKAWLTTNDKRRDEIARRMTAYDPVFMLDKVTVMPLVIDNDLSIAPENLCGGMAHFRRRERYNGFWWVVQVTLDNGHQCFMRYADHQYSNMVSSLTEASWWKKYGKAATRLGMGRKIIVDDMLARERRRLQDLYGAVRPNQNLEVLSAAHGIRYVDRVEEGLSKIRRWQFKLLPVSLNVINYENGVIYAHPDEMPQ